MSERAPQDPVFDKGTKIYISVLLAMVLAFTGHWLYTWIVRLNSPVGELNAQLESDPQLADFPYPFRVLRIKNHTAVVSSPRSAQFSVLRTLAIIHPALKDTDPNSQTMIDAQKALAKLQKHAKKVVLAHPAIEHIQWELDVPWLRRHGIEFFD